MEVTYFVLLILSATVFSEDIHESKTLYTKLCSSTPLIKTALPKATDIPSSIWKVVIGSEVDRNYHSQVVSQTSLQNSTHGKNYGDECFTIKGNSSIGKRVSGEFFAAENLYGTYKCKINYDSDGFMVCVMKSSGPDIRGDVIKLRYSYSDYENNFHVVLSCYPMHKEVGWHTISTTSSLSHHQKRLVNQHIKSLGFSPYSTVSWCTDFNLLNKKPAVHYSQF